MPDLKKEQPIGLFDSGIGGLTIARAITEQLPHERLVYFGDTAHLPYGDKSTAAIQAYSVKICDLLLKHHCKVILIACNSASAAAYELVKEYVGRKAQVLSVIDPMVEYVGQRYAGQRIGLIGTKQTVGSNVYAKKIHELNCNIELASLATPLLVPMIEEGFFNNSISEQVISTYLEDEHLRDIAALILGCTHYPLIKEQIDNYYQGKVELLDSSRIVAAKLEQVLQLRDLAAEKLSGEHKFYVSDFTASFEASTRIFFQREVHLEHYPLWE